MDFKNVSEVTSYDKAKRCPGLRVFQAGVIGDSNLTP